MTTRSLNSEPYPNRRTRFLSSPLWGHGRVHSGPAPVALRAMGVLAARAGVQVRGATIGGADPVVWSGTRSQFEHTGLLRTMKYPVRVGQVRVKEGLIGTIRAVGEGFEITVEGFAIARSPRAVRSLLGHARADASFQRCLGQLLSQPCTGESV